MDDMDNWFIAKDSSKHLENALRWRGCNSDSARKKFTKSSGVRWSELLRLPYFDPIRFITVDPMHSSVNFFKRKPSEYFVPLTFEYLQHKRNIYEGYWYRKPSFLLIKRNTPEVIDIDNLQ